MRSSPRSSASGPVCPNGEMRRRTTRGFRFSSVAGDNPAASSAPAKILHDGVGFGKEP
jgi:hypothetical protein